MSESIDIRELNARIEQQSAFVTNITAGMSHVIVGQQHLVESLLIGLLSDGHVLLEGVPGLAKTLAISTLSKLVDADFNRIQFTPRLAPRRRGRHDDLLAEGGAFPRQEGSCLCQLRARRRDQPRARQGAERAAGGHAGAPGDDRRGDLRPPQALPRHGHTEPHRAGGTYPLPEAQVDRFMLKVIIDYPTIEEEKRIIRGNLAGERTEVYPVTDAQQILHARSVVEEVYIDEKIEQYIADPGLCHTLPRPLQTLVAPPVHTVWRKPPRKHQPWPRR